MCTAHVPYISSHLHLLGWPVLELLRMGLGGGGGGGGGAN